MFLFLFSPDFIEASVQSVYSLGISAPGPRQGSIDIYWFLLT